jgi:hypothetical protein
MMKATDDQVRSAYKTHTNPHAAAKELGVHVDTYHRRLRRLGLTNNPSHNNISTPAERGKGLESRGFKKYSVGASARYYNVCETAKCTGMPLHSGLCMRCTAEKRKAELAK